MLYPSSEGLKAALCKSNAPDPSRTLDQIEEEL